MSSNFEDSFAFLDANPDPEFGSRSTDPFESGSVYPAFGAGGGHTRWVERGWGVNSSDTALYSIYVSTLCRKV